VTKKTPAYPWHQLAVHLPVRGIGLDARIKALGGSSVRLKKPDDKAGIEYEFYDKTGNIVARTISQAWYWVCVQHGITTPPAKNLALEAPE
jgi:hypothetical protein